jgi:hypothetical protein
MDCLSLFVTAACDGPLHIRKSGIIGWD